jgi:hypothetical protein
MILRTLPAAARRRQGSITWHSLPFYGSSHSWSRAGSNAWLDGFQQPAAGSTSRSHLAPGSRVARASPASTTPRTSAYGPPPSTFPAVTRRRDAPLFAERAASPPSPWPPRPPVQFEPDAERRYKPFGRAAWARVPTGSRHATRIGRFRLPRSARPRTVVGLGQAATRGCGCFVSRSCSPAARSIEKAPERKGTPKTTRC